MSASHPLDRPADPATTDGLPLVLKQFAALTAPLGQQLRHRLAVGVNQITPAPPGSGAWILLRGQLRLSVTPPDTAEAATLSPGDVWSEADLAERGFGWVATADTELCWLPDTWLAQTAAFVDARQATDRRLDRLVSAPPPALEDLYAQRPLPTRLDAQPMRTCWQDILGYFRLSPGAEVQAGLWQQPVLDLKDFLPQLGLVGLNGRVRQVTLPQLARLPMPQLLETAPGQFDLVVAAQRGEGPQGAGSALFVRRKGRVEPLVLPTWSARQRYAALSLYPDARLRPAGTAERSPYRPFSLSWYAHLLTQDWLLTLQMGVSAGLLLLFSLGMPLFYVIIFDRVFGRQNLAALNVMTMGLLILLALDFGVRQLRALVLAHLVTRLDHLGSQALVAKVFEAAPVGGGKPPEWMRTVAERLNGLLQANQAVTSNLYVTGLDAALSTVLLGAMLWLNVPMALVSVCSLVPIGIIHFLGHRQRQHRQHHLKKLQTRNQLRLTEAVALHETLHSLNATGRQQAQLSGHVHDWIRQSQAHQFFNLSAGNTMGLIASLGAALTLFAGAESVLTGSLSFGVYLAISYLSRNVLTAWQKFLASLSASQELMSQLQQVQEPFTVPASSALVPVGAMAKLFLSDCQGHLSATRLTVRHTPDAPPAVVQVSLDLQPGEHVALVGTSGAGKSSLLKALQGLILPETGVVCLDGLHLSDIEPVSFRQHVGLVLQRAGLFEGTLRDNLCISRPDADPQELAAVLKTVGLDAFLAQQSQGLDLPVAPLGGNLPTGVVVRVALARVLLLQPAVILLDNVLESLDERQQAGILQRVLADRKGRTTLVVTHNAAVHRLCARVVLMHDGHIAEVGSPEALRSQNGLYAQFYGSLRPVLKDPGLASLGGGR